MNYIECAHCGKQYEITEKILASEGQFVTCTACKRDFLIVINREDETPQKNAEPAPKGVWDPTLTMPESEEAVTAPVREQSLEDDGEGAQVLARIQAEKKKKITLIVLVTILLVAMAAAFFLLQEEVAPTVTLTTTVKQEAVQLSPRAQDENNPVCRQEAAKKWMIDTQAMHGDYTGEEFVRILKRSEAQKDEVLSQCKQENIMKDIIAAATAKEVPSWIAAEIEVLQANRNR